MSTKAIRGMIESIRDAWSLSPEGRKALSSALAEVEAIERAAKDLTRLNLGDGVYDVREMEHVLKNAPDGWNTWEHPDVKAWSDASVLLADIASQEP